MMLMLPAMPGVMLYRKEYSLPHRRAGHLHRRRALARVWRGPHGTKIESVGARLTLKAKGVYRITMVRQEPDDHHLKLTVK
jgi:hypothetical protein